MLENIKQYIFNYNDFKINRKILVFHSDDWGSIRMPSQKVRQELNKNKYIDASDSYTHYDTLASDVDLHALFEVLSCVKDKHGNNVKITANCVMANPDFDKIKKAKFNSYHFETIEKTFSNYNNSKALSLWDEGYKNGLFIPQFHGREHVNAPFWLSELKNKNKSVLKAFDNYVFGVNFKNLKYNQKNFQPAWDIIIPEEKIFIDKAIIEGLKIFKNKFGYRSITAIPPNYTWTKNQEILLKKHGVDCIQGILNNKLRNTHSLKYESSIRFTSIKNDLSFQRRNIFFEPSLNIVNRKKNLVELMLKRLDIAFENGRAAIIGSHRLNFVGVHNENNRKESLRLLKDFLKKSVTKYPDIEFMSADEFHNVIVKQNNNF